MEYKLTHDIVEMISGTSSQTARVYIETTNRLDTNAPEAMGYIKNFITSIESIASDENVKDERITSSAGNIEKFSGHGDIQGAMEFVGKHLSGMEISQNLRDIYYALKEYRIQYQDGYDKQVRLVMLEYESAVYMLVTGLSFAIANNIQVQSQGTQVKFSARNRGTRGVITKTCKDLAKKLNDKNHAKYLNGLLEIKSNMPIKQDVPTPETPPIEPSLSTATAPAPTPVEPTVTPPVPGQAPVSVTPVGESAVQTPVTTVSDTIDIVSSLYSGVARIGRGVLNIGRSIKRTMFGIIPLIRSVMYLRYKRRADTVLGLEQQMYFIRMNIDQLKNMKNVDEKEKVTIIKKQMAVIEAMKKKSEKLRASLIETEREAATEITRTQPQVVSRVPSPTTTDRPTDDFTLD